MQKIQMTMGSKLTNIVLDPGHGGINTQGLYTTQGKYYVFPSGEVAYEGVINRTIAKSLGIKLSNLGYNVIYTVQPTNASDISLGNRVSIANKYSKNGIFISIHNNASGGINTARGFEIFTTPGQNNSDKLGQKIYDSVKVLYDSEGLKLRVDQSDGDSDKESPFYMIKNVNMPAVLIECLFFDNYQDFLKLKDPVFIDRLTDAILQGVLNYLNE